MYSSYKYINRLLFLSAVFLVSASSLSAQVDIGQEMFDSFAARCQSYETVSTQVLAETRSMISSLEKVLNDPECTEPFNPVYNSLFVVKEQLEFLDRDFNGSKKRNLEEKIRRLTFEITLVDPGDIDLLQRLSYELAEARVELLDQGYQEREQRRINRKDAINQLTEYVVQVDSALATQTRCFERHKTLPLQIAGHLVSISGGFFDPTANLALTVAGRVFSSFFNFLGDLNINRKIERLQAVTNEAGISCALEALEQNYCDLQDRKDFIAVQQDYLFKAEVPKAWMGFHLLTREFSRVVRFLRRVETSTAARSEPQGNARGSFEELEGSFNATISRLQGKIGDGRSKLQLIPVNDIATQETTLRSLVSEMADALYGGIFYQTLPSPDQYTRAQLWLRIGTPSPSKSSEESFPDKLAQLDSEVDPRDAVRQRNIDLIEKNLRDIVTAASKQLALERSQTKNPDQQGGLTTWTERTQLEESAGAVIQKIIIYLNQLVEDWRAHPEWFSEPVDSTQRDQINLAIDLRDRFQLVIDILERSNESIEEELFVENQSDFLLELERIYESILEEIDVYRDNLFLGIRSEQIASVPLEAIEAVENAEDLDLLEAEMKNHAHRYRVLMRKKLRGMIQSFPQMNFESLGEVTVLGVRIGLFSENVLEGDYEWKPLEYVGKVSDLDILRFKQDLIFKEMVLRERETVVADRFEQIVQMDLEKRLRAGFLMDRPHLDSFIRISVSDVFDTISSSDQNSYSNALEGLDNAEAIVKGNTDAFFMNFQSSIMKAIRDLKTQADRHQEGPYGASRKKISRLCILALNYPDAHKIKDKGKALFDECAGRELGYDSEGKLRKDRSGQNILIAFNNVQSLSPENRKCLYRRHRREIELSELLEHRPPRLFSSPESGALRLEPIRIPYEEVFDR